MTEAELQRACISHCKNNHIFVVNIHQSGWSGTGFPDLLLCIEGLFVAIELKVGTNKPTKLQLKWGEKIRRAGGQWSVVQSLDEFINEINAITAKIEPKRAIISHPPGEN